MRTGMEWKPLHFPLHHWRLLLRPPSSTSRHVSDEVFSLGAVLKATKARIPTCSTEYGRDATKNGTEAIVVFQVSPWWCGVRLPLSTSSRHTFLSSSSKGRTSHLCKHVGVLNGMRVRRDKAWAGSPRILPVHPLACRICLPSSAPRASDGAWKRTS